jgi:hypothetical protein
MVLCPYSAIDISKISKGIDPAAFNIAFFLCKRYYNILIYVEKNEFGG